MSELSSILITGGTGVVGQPALRALVADGREVRAAVRRPESAAVAKELGAQAVEVDLFDPDAVARAVEGCDTVIHLATSIPPASRMIRPSAWRENDRLRTEATRNLVDGARRSGAARVIAESITFMYPDRGDEWIDETVPFPPPHPRYQSVHDLEATVGEFAGPDSAAVVLRYGLYYGPTARSVDEALQLARLRVASVAGKRDGYVTSVHSDDAGSAVAAALRAPSGVYNVCDDEPVTRRAYADAFADAFGLHHLSVPTPLVGKAGGRAADILLRSQRVSNRKFREATGWAPRYPSVRDGWPAVAGARGEGRH
jgi:nucleoside-diphosphate-sugar epimerase